MVTLNDEDTDMTTNPWRRIIWTDENGRTVKELVCHEDELSEGVDLQFPPGAVVREPVYEYTGIPHPSMVQFFRRNMIRVGDTFTDFINQGVRGCRVIAKNDETGQYIYDYEMPRGAVFMRNQDGKPVSRKRLPKWAREQID
jgi:hypothetical protein